MKLNYKLCIMAAILAVAVIGMVACGEDGKSPVGHSDFQSDVPNIDTSGGNTPAPPSGNAGTDTSTQAGVTFEWVRGKDFFGSGYSCARNGAVGTNWKSPVVEVKVTNNYDQPIHVGYQVFYDKEGGCGATLGGLQGAKDAFVLLEGPKTLGPGETATYRWRIDISKLEGICGGRIQFGFGFNLPNGTFHNERDRVVNIGDDECSPPPPPPTCEGVEAEIACELGQVPNLRTQSVNGEGVPFTCTWSSNAKSCQIFENGELKSTDCNSSAQGYKQRPEPGSDPVTYLWNIVPDGNRQCDPEDSFTIFPEEDPCADSHLNVGESYIEGSTLYVPVNSSSAGIVKALGAQQPFGPGESTVSFPIPEGACGKTIRIQAKNRCEDTASDSVDLDACPTCEDIEKSISTEATTNADGSTSVYTKWFVNDGGIPGGKIQVAIIDDGNNIVRGPKTVSSPDDHTFNFSCQEAGQYFAVVRYSNEQFELSCSARDGFRVKDCPEGPECELPEEGAYTLNLPNAKPETECGAFNASPGDPGFWLYKAASNCYYVSHTDLGKGPDDTIDGFCLNDNGKERGISHVLTCGCPEPEEVAMMRMLGIDVPAQCASASLAPPAESPVLGLD